MGNITLRILHVAHSYITHSKGGVESYIAQLTAAMGQQHKVYIFYPVFGNKKSRYSLSSVTQDSLTVCEIAMSNSSKVRYAELYDGVLLSQFSRFVDDIKPDVVHYHSLINLSMCLLSPEIRAPKVYTAHDFWFMCPRVFLIRTDNSLCMGPENGLRCLSCRNESLQNIPEPKLSWKERLFKLRRRLISYDFEAIQHDAKLFRYHLRNDYAREMLSHVDRIIAPSNLVRERYIDWGIQPGKIIHTRHGLNTDWTEQVHRESSRRIRFSFIGRLEQFKGVDLLIDAFNRLPADAAELKLYGRPASPFYEHQLRALCKHSSIFFMGEFGREQLAEVFSQSDVLVLPSIVYETYGLVVEEALASKTPVIVSNVGGAAEAVRDGLDGFHFERGNVDSLFEKMNAMVKDPGVIQQFKKEMRSVKSMDVHVTEMTAIYKEVLSSPGCNHEDRFLQ